MSYQVLARKWRPGDFSELVGQRQTSQALINALESQRLHHAYLFTGTRGVGKTTIARILSKSLNCEKGITATPCGKCSSCVEISQGNFVDLLEIDAASKTKVEDTRELLDNVQYRPTRGRYKVYLIDEVHMLSGHSFNALLKTLEEPPPHVIFLLATTDPQKMPVTVLSRCLQFHLRRMDESEIINHLSFILEKENIDCESGALEPIAQGADGSMRDALSLLDQAIAYCGDKIQKQTVLDMLGSLDREYGYQLLSAIISEDANQLMQTIASIAEFSPDYNDLLADWLSLLHQLAVCQATGIFDNPKIAELANSVNAADVQLFYQLSMHARRDLACVPHPRQGFEMAMLRILAFKPKKTGDFSTSGQSAVVDGPTRTLNKTEKKTVKNVNNAQAETRMANLAADTTGIVNKRPLVNKRQLPEVNYSENVPSEHRVAENGMTVMSAVTNGSVVTQISKSVDSEPEVKVKQQESNNASAKVTQLKVIVNNSGSGNSDLNNSDLSSSDKNKNFPHLPENRLSAKQQKDQKEQKSEEKSDKGEFASRLINEASVKYNEGSESLLKEDLLNEKLIQENSAAATLLNKVTATRLTTDNWFDVVTQLKLEGNGLQILLNSTACYQVDKICINYLIKIESLFTTNAEKSIREHLREYFENSVLKIDFESVFETTETPREKLIKLHELAIDSAEKTLSLDPQIAYLVEKLEAKIARESISIIK